ncbi:MAG TPA: DNA-3-methyladenine glycosylase I [Kofleriaceae bacterium]|jgi:DNA-3-methyladenine glycosylase I|nr:DNA-3-methyladenine glycosylase I [Kofleriaceae bacterium]
MTKVPPSGLAKGPDGKLRCFWGVSAPDLADYHDREWGFPVLDDRRLFEKLCLEGFQSGLSWLTILRKRDAFRRAFANFDPVVVARFGARDVTRLCGDEAIVRHRGKIESTINNAARALEIIAERGSLSAYVWSFVPGAGERPRVVTHARVRAMPQTPTSIALAKDLKRRGWTFVGPTTVYAFMQAMGLVNDHLEGCTIRPAAEAARGSSMPAVAMPTAIAPARAPQGRRAPQTRSASSSGRRTPARP